MQGKEVLRLVDSLHKHKDIDKEIIFQAIESALQLAARKHYGSDEDITIEIDRESGEIAAVRGDERVDPEMLGRIAAQTAKQVIIQKIREAESESIYEEFVTQQGVLVSGSVQRFQDGDIIVQMEKTEGIVPRSEQVPGEHYQAGDRIRAIVFDIKKLPQKVNIALSRAHPDFLRRLFELEVPEIEEGVVEIVKIVREPGLRSKVAVRSLDTRVDCIGACVGVRGTRIRSIIDELNGEKVDIIPWSEAPEILIVDSLRPAEILKIVLEEGETSKRATVTVPEDQISLAIGRKGQNVRLAVKMSGWDIDIQPPEELQEDLETAEPEELQEEVEAAEPEELQEEVEAEELQETAEPEELQEKVEAEEAKEDKEAAALGNQTAKVEAEQTQNGQTEASEDFLPAQ